MFTLIAKIILIGSVVGMLVIFFRKIPVLAEMSVSPDNGEWKKKLPKKIRVFSKVFISLSKKQWRSVKDFAFQKISQKVSVGPASKGKHLQEDYWQKIKRGK